MQPNYADPVQILALTLYGEIRGGNIQAKANVANVIRNRMQHPRWWGKDWISVCLARWQFSCWWVDDANRQAMFAVSQDDAGYQSCWRVAQSFIHGAPPDITGGADSYYARSMTTPPSWTARATHTIDDGWHSFWRVELADVDHAHDPGAPTVSTQAADQDARADDLNAMVLERLRQEEELKGATS